MIFCSSRYSHISHKRRICIIPQLANSPLFLYSRAKQQQQQQKETCIDVYFLCVFRTGGIKGKGPFLGIFCGDPSTALFSVRALSSSISKEWKGRYIEAIRYEHIHWHHQREVKSAHFPLLSSAPIRHLNCWWCSIM